MNHQKSRTYLVKWDVKVLEQLYSLNLEKDLIKSIKHQVDRVLSQNPYGKFKDIKINLQNCITNLKKLKGRWDGYWRIRFNEYRIIYKVTEYEVIVEIIKIGDRDDVYDYDLD
ncbi:MAG: type II toxin-antitoxin system mRNA interferase toxin, RelE/StbE family [Spiroplasmataceae bacterium]|nr:type II toxin-antitoxin system mRNA interferase toxin, RelE/StbE family [Spiroplasmataceae bacterium]